MNICMMTNTYLPHVGGVARSVQTFTEEYRRRGHQVLVVAPEFPEADSSPAPDETGALRLPAIRQFNGSDFSVSLPLTALFNDAVEQFAADIIHSHHPFLLGDSALRIAAGKHVPVVFTHHTLYEQYTHYLPFDSPTLKQFTIELSTHYANLCDAVIAPSESIGALIRKRGVEVPIQVIPTGIDTAAFAGGDGAAFRKQLGIAPDRFVVGHVGRLAPEKNLHYLARSICRFLKRSTRAVCVIVGGGPMGEGIRELFLQRGLADRLFMPGKRTGKELCDAYAAMDVFAFSSMSETQGLVVAEAMAAGVPVVALDAPGVREVVRTGCNGILLPAEANTTLFATRLAELRSQPALREQLRAGALTTASRFSRERCADQALAYYDFVRLQTRPRRQREREDAWAAMLKRLEIERGLLAEKAKAAIRALFAADDIEEAA